MTRVVAFTVAGEVVGKGRPKFGRLANGGVTTRTPQKTKSYEGRLAYAAQQAMGDGPLIEAPVDVAFQITVPVTAGWPAWKREAALSGRVRPTTKPDADNVAKLALDAMNGVVFRDDTQAVEVRISKRYGDAPSLRIEVRELPALPSQITRKPAA